MGLRNFLSSRKGRGFGLKGVLMESSPMSEGGEAFRGRGLIGGDKRLGLMALFGSLCYASLAKLYFELIMVMLDLWDIFPVIIIPLLFLDSEPMFDLSSFAYLPSFFFFLAAAFFSASSYSFFSSRSWLSIFSRSFSIF